MRVFAALVWREVAERRLLLLASFLLGLVPIVLPWLPGLPSRFTPEEVRTAATFALAVLFGGVTLLMLGATIVGRDLSDRRLGFYFSRPIGSWTLWLSRLAAALMLLVATVLLIVAPAALLDAGSWAEGISESRGTHAWPILGFGEMFLALHLELETGRPDLSGLPGELPPAARLLIVPLLLVLALALVHAVSSIVRGRNLWVLADLAGLGVVSWLLWTARDVLVRAQAPGAMVWAERFLAAAVLAALVAAGGVQLARGRVDLLRGHRYLSAVLWPSLIVAALAAGAYSRWVAGSAIGDLEHLSFVRAVPGDRWLAAGGPVRNRAGARAAFLLDADSGRSWQLGSLEVSRTWLTFSPDGGTAVWARCERYRPPDCELWIKDLRDPASPPRSTGIPLQFFRMLRPFEGERTLTFNHDGTLLAVAEAERLVVYDLPRASGETNPGRATDGAASPVLTAVSAELPHAVAFLPDSRLRFHQRVAPSPEIAVENGWWTQIRELDLDTRQLTETGRLPPMGHGHLRSPVRDTLFYQVRSPHGLGLYDGETGVPLVEIRKLWDYMSGWGHFLADGRLVAGHSDRGRLTLLVLSPEGEKLHQLERDGVMKRWVGGELSPGRLLIGLAELPPPAQTPRHRLDVEPLPGVISIEFTPHAGGWTGSLLDAVTPRASGWTTYLLDADSGTLTPLAAGIKPLGDAGTSPGRLFLAGGQVIRWNPDTGELQTVLEL